MLSKILISTAHIAYVANAKKLHDIKDKAERGDIEAQCWLATCYSSGLYGCKIDKDQAKELFQRVARHSNENLAAVQHAKGACYGSGYGVTKDDVEAAKWFRRAAEQGFAPAQNSLGVRYRNGTGVPQDDQKMLEWYRKAADQGFAITQSNIGGLHANGRAVEQDDRKAVEWYRKAAEQGYANARYFLAVRYQNGKGVLRSDSEAIKWFCLAAEQGHTEAQGAIKEISLLDATKNNDIEVIKQLVRGGADVNQQVQVYRSEAEKIVYGKNRGILSQFLGEKKYNAAVPLLFVAAASGSVKPETVKCLLDLGATSPTSVTAEILIGYHRQMTSSTLHRDGSGESRTTYSDVPDYKNVTIYLLDVVRDHYGAKKTEKGLKKALLEEAMKKWEKK